MGRASLSAPSRPSPTCSLRNPREPRIGEQLLQRLANRTPASAVEVLGDVVSLLRLAEFTELDVESMVSPALREIVYRIQCLVAVCRRGHHRHFRRQPAAVEAERGDVVQQAILGLRIRHGAPGTSTSPAASSPVAQRAKKSTPTARTKGTANRSLMRWALVARALPAATIAAVAPTLVARSQVSSAVRSALT